MANRLIGIVRAVHGVRLLRNLGALTLSHIAGSGIRAIYLIVLARFFGPEGVGVYIQGFTIGLVLLGVAVFGQGTLLSVRLGKSRAGMARVAAHSSAIVAGMVVLATLAGLVFLWMTEDDLESLWALSLFVLAVPPRAVVWWVRQFHVALEQAEWVPRYEIAFRGGEALVGTAALVLGAGLPSLCAIHLLAWTLEAISNLVKLRRRGDGSLALGRDFRLLKPMFLMSAYFLAAVWLLNLHGQIGILSLGFWSPDDASVGHFGVAVQMLSVLLILPMTFGTAALPMVSRGYRRGGEVSALLIFVVKACVVTGGLVAVLGDSLGVWLITTLFGEDFARTGEVFAVLCTVLGPYAVVTFAIQLLSGIGGRGPATVLAVVLVASQISILAVLFHTGPLSAAIFALVGSSLAGGILGVVLIQKRLGIEGYGWWLCPGIAAGAAVAVVALDVLPNVVAAPLAVAILFLLVWWLGVFREGDVQFVRAHFRASAR